MMDVKLPRPTCTTYVELLQIHLIGPAFFWG